MKISDSIIDALTSIKDAEIRSSMLRRIVLNEAYYNIGIIDVIQTKAISGNIDDVRKLILKLKTKTRSAHELFSVEKGTLTKLKDSISRIFSDEKQDVAENFEKWSDTEIYHYTLNKLDVLKAIVEAKLEGEKKLNITKRIENIRIGLHALIMKMRI